MSLYLPVDIQREICKYLDLKDLEKLSAKFLDDEDDVFWKEKCSRYPPKPPNMTYKYFYEETEYEYLLRYYREYSDWYDSAYWCNKSVRELLKDKTFISRHINMIDCAGDTILHYAINNGSHILAKKVIDLGADVNILNSDNDSPLLMALNRSTDVFFLEMLLEVGADVHFKDRRGRSIIEMVETSSELYNLEMFNNYR
jgi:hypothetical protein